MTRGRHAERLRIARELVHQRLVGGAGDAGLGDEEAGGGRDDERRDLGDEAVADGQQRIGRARLAERHAVLRHADDDAGDDVDDGDEQAGDRVAAHEFRGAVHGAEERALVLQVLAALAGGGLVDEAGREVGVDRHLLAGHGVEGEARRDLGDAAGALGDDHEVHDDEDREHDDADDEIAAHHEMAERLDDVAGGGGAVLPVGEDEAGRGEVQRQPHHGRDEQHRRERREFQRRLDEQGGHQDQHGEDDRERQEDVEQHRRQRQDQHDEDRQHAHGEDEIAFLQHLPDVGRLEAEPGRSGARGADIGHHVSVRHASRRRAEARRRVGRESTDFHLRLPTSAETGGRRFRGTRNTTSHNTRRIAPAYPAEFAGRVVNAGLRMAAASRVQRGSSPASSVITRNSVSVFGPKVSVSGTSAASRP